MKTYYFEDGGGLRWTNQGETYEGMLKTHNLVCLDYETKTQTVVHTPDGGWLVTPMPSRESVTGERIVKAPKGTTDAEFKALVLSAINNPTREHELLEHLQEKYEE